MTQKVEALTLLIDQDIFHFNIPVSRRQWSRKCFSIDRRLDTHQCAFASLILIRGNIGASSNQPSAIYQRRRSLETRLSIRNHSKRKRECSTLGISMRSTRGSRSTERRQFVSVRLRPICGFHDLVLPDFLETCQISVTSNDRRFRICINSYTCAFDLSYFYIYYMKCGRMIMVFATAFINYMNCYVQGTH